MKISSFSNPSSDTSWYSRENWTAWDAELLCRQCNRLLGYHQTVSLRAGLKSPSGPFDPDQPEVCEACLKGLKYLCGMEGINDAV